MEEQLIIFKTAKLAKKKGFYFTNNISTRSNNIIKFYNDSGALCTEIDYTLSCCDPNKHEYSEMPAPTQSLLNKWIRETKGIHLTVERNASGWYWAMCQTDGGTGLGYSEFSGPNEGGVWESFEEAFENGLQTALIIKLKKFGHWSNFAMHAIKALKKYKEK